MEKIVGIGVDEIEKERVLKACEKHSFLCRTYSEEERLVIQKKQASAATNFAGKEAVAKALGTGFTEGITPIEIEILRNDNGSPYVQLSGNALKVAQRFEIDEIHISLSDSETMAIAFAVAVQEIE